MSHDWHERLRGFDPGQIWVDSCRECEQRARLPFADQLGWLDDATFARAWQRTTADVDTLSAAEAPLIHTLAAVQTLIARTGVLV